MRLIFRPFDPLGIGRFMDSSRVDQVDRRSRLNACIASTPVEIFGQQSVIKCCLPMATSNLTVLVLAYSS